MQIVKDFQDWAYRQRIKIEWVSDRKFLCGGKNYFLIDDEDKDVVIDEDFELIVSHEEIEVLQSDFEISFIVFRIANKFYYSTLSRFEIIPFRYIDNGCSEDCSDFYPLSIRGKYELGSGSRDYSVWVKKAKFMGIKALGICEDSTLAGTMVFQTNCLNNNIKSILGMRIKVQMKSYDYYYLKVYAKNKKGWKNLVQINSNINVFNDGFIFQKDLLNLLEGVIVVIDKENNSIEKIIETFSEKNEEGDLYYQIDPVEYLNPGYDKEALDNLYSYYGYFLDKVKPVLIADSFYIDQCDYRVKKVLSSIIGKKEKESDNQHLKFPSEIREQLSELFGKQEDFEEFYSICFNNQKEIVDKCNFNINTKNLFLPKYKFSKKEEQLYKNSNDLLLDIIDYNFEEKVIKRVPQQKVQIYLDRLKEELKVIRAGNVVDYFLILWDIVRWCRKQDILVGFGRGSAAGSLLSYLLDITRVDPIEYGLLFERFLSQARLGVEKCKINTFKEESFEETEIVEITNDEGVVSYFKPEDQVSILRQGSKIDIFVKDLVENDIILL